MSNDLVERLRSENTLTGYYDPPQLQEEAADEIERLRAERDEAVATLARYRAENGCTRGQRTTQWCAEATSLRAALRGLLSTVDACKTMEVGAGGMTIEAQMKRTVYLRVPMWPFEEARAALGENSHD